MAETNDDSKKGDSRKIAVKKVVIKLSVKKPVVNKTKVILGEQESSATAVAKKSRKAKFPYAELIKKQAELDAIKKAAKSDLKKKYDAKIAEAVAIQGEDKWLFNEPLHSSDNKIVGAKEAIREGNKCYTLYIVKTIIDQTNEGKAIKSLGRMQLESRRSKQPIILVESRMQNTYLSY
jgi:hypothetical protein